METSQNAHPANAQRLFIGSCIALIATAVAFATVGNILLVLKREFILTNEEAGWIGGAALWGFAVSQVLFSPFCDTLGMRYLLRLAFVGHLVGVAVMIMAGGFWMLFFGALIIALANGLVEAACNPLVATLYPDDKTVKLNRFHVWFPGGIVLGGVAAYLLGLTGIVFLQSWQMTLGLILIPTIIYGFMMLKETFPDTEGVQAGVSMKEMFKVTFTTPLFLLLLFCMIITASTELGPNRWVPAVLEAGNIPGILVLVWISGLMAVLRYYAGPVVHKLSPTGILLGSAVVSAIGLYWLSFAESTLMAFVSATVFAVGVCYFWPTMLGVTSERVPRSGALGLGLMGAMGMAIVGLLTSPMMGKIADEKAHEQLPVAQTVSLMEEVSEVYPGLLAQVPDRLSGDVQNAIDASQEVLAAYRASNTLPELTTANALRAIQDSHTGVASTGQAEGQSLPSEAGAILGPADNYGGRISFRYIVPFTCLLIIIFGILYLRDRKAGGYKVRAIHE